MIEPVNVPIILDLELSQVEYDLSVEEAEEYAAQIGSLITISEVYGGLPSGGNAGEILIKNSGEDYDAIWGTIKNGANIWWTNHLITQGDTSIYTAKRHVVGRTDMQPEIHDFLVGRDIETTEGTPNTLYEIIDINQLVYNLKRIGNIGENDYNRLLNKPQIDGIEINKNSTSTSLGLATASALEEKYTKPSDGIPASDLADDVHLIPSGGTIGQILRKISNNDWDIDWGGPIEDGNAIWLTSAEPSTVTRLGVTLYYYSISDLSGADGRTPQSGDIIVKRGTFVYAATNIFGSFVYVNGLGSIKGDPGQDGVGVPSGGQTGMVLKKASNTDYDTEWADESGGGGSNFVEYGTGTNAQIEAFYQAEQMCACKRDSGSVLPLMGRLSASYHVFSAAYNNTVYMALCRNNEWWTVTRELARLSDIPDVDDALSDSSANPVQNKVIKAALDAKGTYSKPSGGIPKTDLASAVQTSLGKADTALQEVDAQDVRNLDQYISGFGYYTKPSGGIPKTDLASAVQASLDKADTALQSSPVFVCTYGTTTATEVADALTAGKIVVVRYAENIYELSYLGDLGNDRIYYFTNVAANKVNTLSLIQSTWTNEGSWTIPSPSSSNPSAPGTAAPGTSSLYARADHVHPKPTAADVGAVAVAQGMAHAGEFCVVGSDGNITTVAMTAWQGGSY